MTYDTDGMCRDCTADLCHITSCDMDDLTDFLKAMVSEEDIKAITPPGENKIRRVTTSKPETLKAWPNRVFRLWESWPHAMGFRTFHISGNPEGKCEERPRGALPMCLRCAATQFGNLLFSLFVAGGRLANWSDHAPQRRRRRASRRL